jgi:hypothetical protein
MKSRRTRTRRAPRDPTQFKEVEKLKAVLSPKGKKRTA